MVPRQLALHTLTRLLTILSVFKTWKGARPCSSYFLLSSSILEVPGMILLGVSVVVVLDNQVSDLR